MRHLPNLLTGIRLALTPLALWAILGGSFRRALAIVALAGLTDGLDGLLARRLKASSRLGAYLDPIADKLLLSGAYLALGLAGFVPVWLVGLILGRDLVILAMVGAALLFTSKRDFPPSVWGKLSTLCQLAAAVVVLVALAFPEWRLRPGLLLWIAAAATAWSGVDYVWRAIVTLRSGAPTFAEHD